MHYLYNNLNLKLLNKYTVFHLTPSDSISTFYQLKDKKKYMYNKYFVISREDFQ